ncbi:DUF2971 domain-containing protein [Saccharococcus caldoxylosilyticus]|uniref:DUF2971 domain-containing protein n=1 Tax=Saccharococcus caldoxylosilyticus TaxID=81408 RepID=A0A150KVR1_9BACL|nr:DUF2971 domain-containing protein [Parageobacillus caldoxylosilyticus]KYD04130.1 hypothetical protein B4119_0165 [Parageobacillus caldoxylosilyticus]QXJ38288.1 hypothetical protein BV455_01602 [Parageobacillus caldoxylosilyticus]BDG34244.1 DUF2971 domain-containing protein [Parageobacillus caldoxylosilyticus]BDG38012.1 DUF2971 domain-containing protein [Parageobacillus caldoxylosilyticus]
MDLSYKYKAYKHAMDFESIYDYSDHYKVRGNPTVWRYMSFYKFESLLKNKALFFAKPSTFVDPLEGSYSMWDIKEFMEDNEPLTSREYMRKIQEFSAVSCWHMNEYESAAMWDLYLDSNDGVAIKTDYKSLINSIEDLRYRVFSAKVQYIDFHNEMTSRNIFDTLFYKRKSFSYENELRLLIIASRIDEKLLEVIFEAQGLPYYEWEERMDELEEQSYNFSHNTGNLVACNLDTLIGEIYVSPKSSKAFVDEIRDMVKQYGLSHKKVVQSDLYKDYVY